MRIPNWVNSSLVRSDLEPREPGEVARILATASEKTSPLGLVIEPEIVLSVRLKDFYDRRHSSMDVKCRLLTWLEPSAGEARRTSYKEPFFLIFVELVPSSANELALGIWFYEDVRRAIGPVLSPVDVEDVIDRRRTGKHLHEENVCSIDESMTVCV